MSSPHATLVFRLLKEDQKETRLLAALQALRGGTADAATHQVNQAMFRMVPGAPFAYWVSDDMRAKFKELKRLEGTSGQVRQGLATANDFRFVRLSWEVPANRVGQSREDTYASRPWIAFAKGGEHVLSLT